MISKILNKVDAPFDENVIDIEKEKLIIAGPCAIESYDQLLETARFIKSKGVKILRGGAYKPRTSPFAFQGMRKEGLEILKAVKQSSVVRWQHINLFGTYDFTSYSKRVCNLITINKEKEFTLPLGLEN